MIKADKRVGETPLEFLNRLRIEMPEIKNSVLSYAGRLDPMAEGEMIVMVGEENKNRDNFLGLDKEYIATFLFGVSTDSGDVLGLITNQIDKGDYDAEISQREISASIESFPKIKTQKYPWFSSKTVFGIKLFEYFKRGDTYIERPTREVDIKEVEILKYENINSQDLKNYIFESINKVTGDFRQKETLEKWQKFFETAPENLLICEIRILVSSGTYIRALTENFPTPTTLLKLKRTKILL